MHSKRCMIIAGEPSGDTLAAELVRALRDISDWEFFGAGGSKMAAAGVDLELDLTAHAVVGIWEVVKHYPELRGVFNRLLRLAQRRTPDLIILVDYPGFNLRFVQAVKRLARAHQSPFHNWSPRIVYYVSPQIWAWHESRVHQIARDVDLMLSIFPFEKAWYARRVPQFRVEFVGHPLVDRYAGAIAQTAGAGLEVRNQRHPDQSAALTTFHGSANYHSGVSPISNRPNAVPSPAPLAISEAQQVENLRNSRLEICATKEGERYGSVSGGLPSKAPLVSAAKPPRIVLLPGSRIRELNKHLPVILETVRLINARQPVQCLMVLPSQELVDWARKQRALPPGISVQACGLAEALRGASLAVAASGTVTMECAFFGVPAIVLYKTSWGTYRLGKWLIRAKYIAMPNLLADGMVFPEFIQHSATPEALAGEALDLLANPQRVALIKQELATVITSLGEPGACRRAAKHVNGLFGVVRYRCE